MERKTRVRFAPSPTGPLHIGGVRTALYNYLYAKGHGGDFVLRIEDTDSRRFVPGAEQYIIDALAWCGILPDEGVDENGKVVETPSERHPHAPYRQSQRRELYFRYARQLVAGGHAYYAFDTPEELAAKRSAAEAAGQTFIYNYESRKQLRNSLTLSPEETERLLRETDGWTVRFKMPEGRTVRMDDLIRGHIEVDTCTLDDKVLWKKADGLPTYHLANIVDDHLMEITEVIRGEEWLPSLPLHYLLYEAFGWEETRPRFAHLSLLLKPSGKGKLSKRDGDQLGFPVFPLRWTGPEGEIAHGYREDGYFPEAFVNLLALLGWNPGDDRELFTLEELVGVFSLDRIIRSGARFNPEKARWFNREYLRKKTVEELTEAFLPLLREKGMRIVEDTERPECVAEGSETAAEGAEAGAADAVVAEDTDGTAEVDFNAAGADFAHRIFTRGYVRKVIALLQERATFIADFWDIAAYLFQAPAHFEEKDVAKFWKPENRGPVQEAAQQTARLEEPMDKTQAGECIESYIRSREWPMGKVMNGLRLALTGAASGLGIADIVTLLGRREVAARLRFIREQLG